MQRQYIESQELLKDTQVLYLSPMRPPGMNDGWNDSQGLSRAMIVIQDGAL